LYIHVILIVIIFIIESVTPIKQSDFRSERNYIDQISAFTMYIENGFQKKEKTIAVLINLSAAYDTVWWEGQLLKFFETIQCLILYKLLNKILTNRIFTVHIGGKKNTQWRLNNELPQGSVLAPILFNL
jgi:hypothetical protein